jgi:DNA repair exonuclease SbcCD nuclease subunit
MKLFFTGDWQCSVSNLDRCELYLQHLEKLVTEASKSESVFVVHLGDIKETLNPVDQRVTNFIVDAVKRLKKVLYVRGNHDYITTQDGVASCAPVIRSAGAATVADTEWVMVPLRLVPWHGRPQYCLIYMVPYFRDPEKQREEYMKAAGHSLLNKKEYRDPTCDAIGKDNITILAFHNTVTGCRQNLYTCGEGFTLDEMGAGTYDYCVGGHIHHPQLIKPNIYYVGSPFAMDWSEVNSKHRTLVLNIK